jgi:hypothetical protein
MSEPKNTSISDAEIKRRVMALLADANNDDETEATIRAGLNQIEESLGLFDPFKNHPKVAAHIEDLRNLYLRGVALLLLHREQRLN